MVCNHKIMDKEKIITTTIAFVKKELKNAIDQTLFSNPICPIYQNVSGKAVIDAEQIKANLIAQLTAPVKWTQTMKNMSKNKKLFVHDKLHFADFINPEVTFT